MRIVIVEDEAPIREGLAKILHKINPDYELVGKAGDGKAGYELIRRMEPDLVILDIQMPNAAKGAEPLQSAHPVSLFGL